MAEPTAGSTVHVDHTPVPSSAVMAPSLEVKPANAASNDRTPNGPVDSAGTKAAASRTQGTRLLLFGAQHGVWRPSNEGLVDGFAATIQTASLSHRDHVIGRQRIAVALGSSNAGFDWNVDWSSALGAGVMTLNSGLLYARLGFETLTNGNSRTGTKLLAPLLELGHFWATPSYHIDLGTRVDIPVMGGLYVSEWHSAYHPQPNLGGFVSARVGRVLLDWQIQRRQLERDDWGVTHFEGTICSGKFVVLCTGVSEYVIQRTARAITQVTVAVGLGSLERND